MSSKRKNIIAITGASGSIYAADILKNISKYSSVFEEIAVIFSKNGKKVFEFELGKIPKLNKPFRTYENTDLFGAPASGSAGYDSMVVIPCSMGTLGRIAAGISGSLIERAADVMLKERRKLILVTRETPLNLIHLRNMETVTLAGGIILPASPSFYSKPKTFSEVIDTVTDKVLPLIIKEYKGFEWK
ncbi:MAG: 3-octaprenyl-4-hydroxybenzoate carboxy-lyase [Bacteroidetes bacterium HGW-Bacteroidetes-21]|nr:MAG: 3-octaprenyl-4-hydroxybenzoate carboxy-lyase [Bacteroidetes bacterium HGW-Bacteroidetes-21]